MEDIVQFLEEIFAGTRPDALEALAAFLCAKITLRDWNDTKLSPSPRVRRLWAHFILSSAKYAIFCEEYADGNYIHYRPESAAEPEEPMRYLTAYLLVDHATDTIKDSSLWPVPPQLVLAAASPPPPPKKRVRVEDGHYEVHIQCAKTLRVRDFTLIGDMKRAACTRLGIPYDDAKTRLQTGAGVLRDEATAGDYKLGESEAPLELNFLE